MGINEVTYSNVYFCNASMRAADVIFKFSYLNSRSYGEEGKVRTLFFADLSSYCCQPWCSFLCVVDKATHWTYHNLLESHSTFKCYASNLVSIIVACKNIQWDVLTYERRRLSTSIYYAFTIFRIFCLFDNLERGLFHSSSSASLKAKRNIKMRFILSLWTMCSLSYLSVHSHPSWARTEVNSIRVIVFRQLQSSSSTIFVDV